MSEEGHVAQHLRRMYFKTFEEANEWLDFDEEDVDDEERELFAYRYPDQFGEWRRWQAAWKTLIGAFSS